MKKVVDRSSLLQMILELATYGYLLFSDWRSRADGQSIKGLSASFRARQARWESFDFINRRHVAIENADLFYHEGILGVTGDDESLQFYRLNDRSFKSGDPRPWREYETEFSELDLKWDEDQDLLILSGYFT